MKLLHSAAALALAGAASAASGAPSQPVSGPVAVYWMSAETQSGMGGMGGMQGGHRPSMAEIMAMQQGGGGGAYSEHLLLQLGSSRRPESGDPAAEHDPPQGLGAGPSLPLVTPVREGAPPPSPERGGPPQQYQPQGRLLIFWGCGAHAGPNQPMVIDFADPQAGAAKFAALQRAIAVTPEDPPSPARNATYGEWPNARSDTQVGQGGSLQGAHTIRGNYSPEIDFTLAADQDFLPPIQITDNRKSPDGSAELDWRRVDGAQGYILTVVGAQGRDQMVMWASSATPVMGFALPDYLSDGDIGRLVANKVLLPPGQTSCQVPAEAVQAMGQGGVYRMVAYGGEANLSSPPRPPAPQPWRIEWQVKIRYKSDTSGMLGVDMSQMGAQQRQGQPPPQHQQHPSNPFNPFGGFIP